MTALPLHESIRSVSSSEELAAFIVALRSDFDENRQDWENVDLPSAFEAMAAWLRDMQRAKNQRSESLATVNPFQLCAQVLYAAKVYE
jgi:hypothetical protein